MTKYVKKNYVIGIYYIIIGLIFISSILPFFSSNLNFYSGNMDAEKETCIKYKNANLEEKKEIEKDITFDNEICTALINEYKPGSFYLYYNYLLRNGVSSFVFPFFIPLMVIFPIVYKLSEEFRSKYIKNYLQRNEYNEYIKSIIKRSYKYILIVPILLLSFAVVASICSKLNFDPRYDIAFSRLSTEIGTYYNKPFFYISYVLIILFNMGIYINIGLIILRKNKNFFVALIESFVAIYVFLCFTFITIGLGIQSIFNIPAESINLLEIYTWSNISNIGLYLLVNIVYFVVSFILVIIVYKNKEKFIKECEK